MFTQQKLFFQFTTAIALVILFCFTFSCQAQGEKAVKENANDMPGIMVQIEYYEGEFEKYIKERLFVEFKKEFKGSRFDKIADLLGDNTVLGTPQGERLKGKDSLARFWRKEKERGITDVDFTLKYHYVSKVSDPIEHPDPQYTIVHIGHAIIDYHLIKSKKEETLTNQNGTLTICAPHPWMCEWQL